MGLRNEFTNFLLKILKSMHVTLKTYYSFCILCFSAINIFTQKHQVSLENQVSSWATLRITNPLVYQLGGRYIPSLTGSLKFKENSKLDAEVAINMFIAPFFNGSNHTKTDADIKPYRLWLRYSSTRLEIRAGLQKINFGTAYILRPLMWFDSVDPRDPLQLTDGVYALLGRYYFQNNANLWVWGLYGNTSTKGWETTSTEKDKPEFGGRLQLPVLTGETGISYNFRHANYDSQNNDTSITEPVRIIENKFGLDSKFDAEIGIWYELVIVHNSTDKYYLKTWNDYINIGIDYTYNLGNGLNMSVEFFRINATNVLFRAENNLHFTAVSMNYPIDIINRISLILFMNHEDFSLYNFLSWQQTYDYLTFWIMAYHNPENYSLYNLNTEQLLYAGTGLQIMAALNF